MCTFSTNKIFLTWRKGQGHLRHVIGVLERNNKEFIFKYIKDNCEKAKKDGFSDYPAFPTLDEVYFQDVMDVFKRRLLNPNRKDYDEFLSYWSANDYRDDAFALLGLTGAKLQTDNFEFIAPHEEIPAIFYTDISWLSMASQLAKEEIRAIDNLSEIDKHLKLEKEPNNNADKSAVKVLFKDEKLGYVKSIHCENICAAINNNKNISLRVKNIIKNGTIKEILLRVQID